MKEKSHYRKVFKSDHLSIADLEDLQEDGHNLVFTINEVRQEFNTPVAGRKINANIAYFKEEIKPLVLNATNSKVVKSFNHNSPWVEDWSNTIVKLYIDENVKMKGEIVGGVRIAKTQPTLSDPKEMEKIKLTIADYVESEELIKDMPEIIKNGVAKNCVENDVRQIGLDKLRELKNANS
jgi:hypothetical protein